MSPVALWHRLASITWLGWYGVVGWILGPLEIMGLSGWCHRLLGVILRTGGHHCVGGSSNHRSWLTAHLVQAAAGTDTAADGDGQNNDKSSNTKDHGQSRVMSR